MSRVDENSQAGYGRRDFRVNRTRPHIGQWIADMSQTILRPNLAASWHADSRPLELLISVAEGRPGEPNPYAILFSKLRRTLESLGSIQVVEHPESRLAFAAHRAELRGSRPIHLAFAAPHQAYLTPSVVTAIVPLWGFRDIPSTELSRDARQNWKRIAGRADALFVSDSSLAKVFRDAQVETPIEIVPTPVSARLDDVHAWSPERSTMILCRHVAWGGPPPVVIARDVVEASTPVEPPRLNIAEPPHGPIPPPRLARLGQAARALPGRARRVAARSAKRGYDRLVRRWLSQEAHDRLRGLKRAILRGPALPARAPGTPSVASPSVAVPERNELRLQGLVFLAEVDYTDPGVNDVDLITSFLFAFRDRADATLVVRLRTTPEREPNDFWRFAHHYEIQYFRHQCRLVVISESLNDESHAELFAASKFVVDTRKSAREAWLIDEARAAGRPLIAPAHSALTDRLDPLFSLLVRSSPEPAAWPHDPLARRETLQDRLDWNDLRRQLTNTSELSSEAYRSMATFARHRSDDGMSTPSIARAWREALDRLPHRSSDTLSWTA